MNEDATYYTDLITRYFSGEITPEELRLLTDWLRSDAQNRDFFNQYRKTWLLIEKQKVHSAINMDQEWLAMQAKLDAPSVILQATESIPLSAEPRISSFKTAWRIAAAVAVLLVSTFMLYFYLNKPSDIIVTAQAENMEQLLPDGSVVSLHAGSQLIYPEKFSTATRNVQLKGEAYFKVAHNKAMPFIVATGNARIEVLGTQFNVNSNSSAGSTQVVLTEGKVSLYYEENPGEKVLLMPGEKAEFVNGEKAIRKSVNSDPNYMAWKTRVLVFDNEPLGEVINTLQNVYQTRVSLNGKQLSDCRVTASFNNQSLQSVLEVLKETLDLQVNQDGKNIVITGQACR